MESKAHFALIGVFVLLFFIMGIAFVAWLSNAQFDQKFDDYEVIFSGPVRGLSEGSEVRFNGLRVGEVTGLTLDPSDSDSVLTMIQVGGETPVHASSYAQLEPLGLTGLNYIQIFSGGEDMPLLKDLPGKGPYRIPGKMSQIDSFVEGGTSVIEGAQRALSGVNMIMSETAITDFQGILANLNVTTKKISEVDIDPELVNRVLLAFETAAKDVSEAAEAVDAAALDTNKLVNAEAKSLLARAEVSLAEVDETLASIRVLSGQAGDTTEDVSDAINRLSRSGFTDLEETTDALRRVMLTMERIADKLEQNPVQFIAGEKKIKVELPQ